MLPPTAQLVVYEGTDDQYVLVYGVHSEADNESESFAADIIIDSTTGTILSVQDHGVFL